MRKKSSGQKTEKKLLRMEQPQKDNMIGGTRICSKNPHTAF